MTKAHGWVRRVKGAVVGLQVILLLAGTPAFADDPTPLNQEGVVSMAIKDANALVVVETIVINGKYNFVTRGKIDQTVSVNLRDVSIQDALDAVTQTVGLEYRVQGKIITLYGTDSDSSYTVTYKFNVGSVTATGGPGTIIKRLVEGGSDADAAAAAGAGGGAPPPDAGGGGGGGAGGPSKPGRVIVDRLNNQLIVTAVPSIHRRVERLVKELDKPTLIRGGRTARIFELRYITPEFFRKAVQFEIPGFQESQVLLFSDTGGANAPAVQVTGAGAVNLPTGDIEGNSKRVLVTDIEENLNKIENLLKAIDRPPRQVFLDVKLINLSKTTLNRFGNQLRLIYMRDGRSSPVGEFFGGNAADAAGNPFHLRVGTLGPEQFSLLADYIERDNKSNILQNPKLTVIDGRPATIRSIRDEPYGESTLQQGTVQTTVKFIPVGITLNFTANVVQDNQVKLAVQPEVSATVRTVTVGSGDTANQVPVVSKTSATTTLLVPNLHTALIGGILQHQLEKGFQTMPVLGHLPLLGRLFHRHDDTDSRDEFVITITTKIINRGDNTVHAKHKGVEQGKMKYFFHDYEQIMNRIVFIDEVIEY